MTPMPTATTLPIPFETFYDTRGKTAEIMHRHGGSFAQGLAIALCRADRNNARRIYDAFPDLLEPYTPGGQFHQP